MVGTVLKSRDEELTWDELLRPEPLGGGAEPEQRIVFCGVSWNRYRHFKAPDVWFWRRNKIEVFGMAWPSIQ